MEKNLVLSFKRKFQKCLKMNGETFVNLGLAMLEKLGLKLSFHVTTV